MTENLYTDRVEGMYRTFFFDVKKSEKGKILLFVTESSRGEEGFERQRLLIPDTLIRPFYDAMQRAAKKVHELASQETKPKSESAPVTS